MAHFPAHFPKWLADFYFQHSFLIPTMTLATICRNGSEPFERTLLTVLTACLYHLSSSILHSFTFLFSLSFTFFHPHFRSYTFHFSISLTFIHLYLFSFTFILIRSTSFTFIHTHFGSLTLGHMFSAARLSNLYIKKRWTWAKWTVVSAFMFFSLWTGAILISKL